MTKYNCQFCFNGIAKYICLGCYDDDEEDYLLCIECAKEHLEAQGEYDELNATKLVEIKSYHKIPKELERIKL